VRHARHDNSLTGGVGASIAVPLLALAAPDVEEIKIIKGYRQTLEQEGFFKGQGTTNDNNTTGRHWILEMTRSAV
jgi:hypothetical protein